MMHGRPDSHMSLKYLVFQSTKSKMSSSDTGPLNIAYSDSSQRGCRIINRDNN